MKKIVVFSMMSMLLLLGACSKDEGGASNGGSATDGEATPGFGTIDHGVDEKKVGFNLSDGSIEEAANVPVGEKEKILAVFTSYIDRLNNKDIDGYFDILSDQSGSFDKVEERSYLEQTFEEYDVTREVSDVTVVTYSENEAQVFANLQTKMKQLSSGLETNPSGRQVTVFTKDDGEWKVSAVHYLGDEAKK
ncbi:nuclear transport factor 2 family protein [Sporosarcina sp. NPDC096371]|uniref:nuclear transport factor 2 family protein n=1 Tax=Sporosarcina sp. NPDC096371 TaxID=3364530 RepID=UPI0037FE979F